MSRDELARLARGVQNFATALAALVTPAQIHVKDAGGNQSFHAEDRAGIGQPAQRGEVSGQLNLDAVLQQQRVNLLRARFIVDHHAERGGAS